MKNCIPNYSVNIPYQFHPHLLSDMVTMMMIMKRTVTTMMITVTMTR